MARTMGTARGLQGSNAPPRRVHAEPRADVLQAEVSCVDRIGSTKLRNQCDKRLRKTTGYASEVDRGLEYAINIAVSVAKEEGFDEKMVNSAESICHRIMSASRQLEIQREVFQEAKDFIRQQVPLDHDWNKYIKGRTVEHDAKYSAADSEYSQRAEQEKKQLKRKLWDLQHEGEPMPGEEDEDLVVVEKERTHFMCPLSQEDFVDPVQAPCGHTFSRLAMKSYHASYTAHKAFACPQPGCNTKFRMKDLKDDVKVAREMRKYKEKMENERLRKRLKGEDDGGVDLTQPDM